MILTYLYIPLNVYSQEWVIKIHYTFIKILFYMRLFYLTFNSTLKKHYFTT